MLLKTTDHEILNVVVATLLRMTVLPEASIVTAEAVRESLSEKDTKEESPESRLGSQVET